MAALIIGTGPRIHGMNMIGNPTEQPCQYSGHYIGRSVLKSLLLKELKAV